MIEFAMPSLGADMDEGTLDEWLVKPGQPVTRGQVIAVVETSKADVEVECWHDGTINELLVPVGETVRVGTVLATLSEPGTTATTYAGRRSKHTDAPSAAEPLSKDRIPASAPPASPPIQRRRWVSPAARRLAASRGIDTDTVAGTGPQGSVTISDVEQAAAKKLKPERNPTHRAAQMRRSIATAMSRSKREIPHYYLADDILLDNALRWLTERNAARPITERVLLAVLQLKATAIAAQRLSEFNGFWHNEFEPAQNVHVGVAISLRSGGLVAPAIHDAADKDIDTLMADLTDLVARARAGTLRSSEMSDPTITITNLGDQGVAEVFGVIYPPQVALVGFGAPAQRVCAVDGAIRIATAVRATLAADHRASDGHRGALFLTAINELLQQPEHLEK
jgi:pyruvate dehydrogenase E2 component (dihydrolipoamide acetyltransferase)